MGMDMVVSVTIVSPVLNPTPYGLGNIAILKLICVIAWIIWRDPYGKGDGGVCYDSLSCT